MAPELEPVCLPIGVTGALLASWKLEQEVAVVENLPRPHCPLKDSLTDLAIAASPEAVAVELLNTMAELAGYREVLAGRVHST